MVGVTAAGGGRWAAVRFGSLPQVLPVMASQVLYYFESNTRSATIIGIVGAGGIGQDLMEAIRKFYYPDVSAILVLIIITVALIDLVTERVRHHFITQVS